MLYPRASTDMGKPLRVAAVLAVVMVLVLATVPTDASVADVSGGKQVSRVVEITSENIGEYISTPQTKNVAILFCVAWSQACKGMMNTYHHLSMTMAYGRFRNVVTIAYIDGEKEKALVERMGITGFPTLVYYTPTEPQGVEFYGFREHALMESFIFQYT